MVKRSLNSEIGGDEDSSGRTMAELVYRRLRADIVWGVLAPDVPLKSDQVRAAYGTGISPLREALTRLTAERLVTAAGQRGFRVAPLSPADVLDTMETRILIESEALRLSIEKGDVNWETSVVAAAHALRRTPLPTAPGPAAEAWAELHQRYHAALLAACGSPWLISLADILFAQAERHRIRAVSVTEPIKHRDRPAEHDAILDAVVTRNARLATAELDRHYRLSANHVAQAILQTTGGAGIPGGVTNSTESTDALATA